MINLQMRLYPYSFVSTSMDEYGQEKTEVPAALTDKIKMAINLNSQSVTDDIRFKEADYVGLTNNSVDDTYIIHYGKEKLKVIYVNPFGRLKQVFMKRM